MKTLPFPGNLETAFYDEQTTWLNTTDESLSSITWKRTSCFEFCASFLKWFLQLIHHQIPTDLRINLLLFEGDSCWFSCFIFLVSSCFTFWRLPGVCILVPVKVQTLRCSPILRGRQNSGFCTSMLVWQSYWRSREGHRNDQGMWLLLYELKRLWLQFRQKKPESRDKAEFSWKHEGAR